MIVIRRIQMRTKPRIRIGRIRVASDKRPIRVGHISTLGPESESAPKAAEVEPAVRDKAGSLGDESKH